jgi:D-sedoheptulose 7-phosphate isomerase
MVCGNGGSTADSEHIVGELMKGFLLKREISCDNINKLKKNSKRSGVTLLEIEYFS